MNELFLIPAIISSIIIVILSNIKKIGNKLILGFIILLTLVTTFFIVVTLKSTDWARLGYAIMSYISTISLISAILTLICQKQKLKTFIIILIINALVVTISTLTLGMISPITSLMQCLLYVNLTVGLVQLVCKGVPKLFIKNKE